MPRYRYFSMRPFATAAVALAVVLAGCADPSTPAEQFAQAQQYHADGEPRSALIQLRNALQQDSSHVEARGLLGRIHLELEDPASAEKELGRALELGETDPVFLVEYAVALVSLNQPDAALERLVVEPEWDSSTRARAHAVRAQAHVVRHEYPEAGRELARADEAEPGHLEAYLAQVDWALAEQRNSDAGGWAERATAEYPEAAASWRAASRVALAKGDLVAAEAALDRAIEHGVHSVEDRLLRARLRIAADDAAGARADLDGLGGNAAGHPRVLFIRGLTFWAEEDYEAACTEFQQAVSQAGEYVEARLYLGGCYLRDGQLNQALSHLRWVQQRAPDPHGARLLGATYLARGELEEARAVVQPVVNSDPDDVNAQALLSRIEAQRGDSAAALEHFRAVAQQRPDDPDAQLRLGTGLLEGGDIAGGQRVLGEVLALDPDLTEVGVLLVVSHVEAGEFRQALEQTEAMAERHPESALPWTLAAVVHLARQDAESALEALEEAIEREPADPAARHYLARMTDDPATARGHYEHVLDVHPEHVQTLIGLARIEDQAGDADRVESLLRQAHEADPAAVRPRVILGAHYLERDEPRAALRVLQGPDGAVPSEPAMLELAARAHLAMGATAEAVGLLERLVANEPEHVSGRLLLAQAYTRAGREDEAIDELETVLTLQPDHLQAAMILIRVSIRQGRFEQARDLLEALPDALSGTAYTLVARAELATGEGDTSQAAEYYGRAMEAQPSSELAIMHSQALFRDGQHEDAASALEAWLRDEPDDTAARMASADLAVRQGRDAAAVEAYESVLEADPEAVSALNNIAWLLREEDPERALQYAERAVALQPNNSAVRDTLGVVLLEAGQPAAAAQALQRSMGSGDGSPAQHYHLARALAASGDRVGALEAVRTALGSEAPFDHRDAARELLAELE